MSGWPADIAASNAALARGQLTSVELVQGCLNQIAEVNPHLRAVVEAYDASALTSAAESDRRRRNDEVRGPLDGIPIGVKDVIAVAEGPTTAGSRAWSAQWHPGDAAVVARLRAAGAVITAKAHTLEFATGMPDRADGTLVTRNPWSSEHWTGGSSSGSAAGVAAGFFQAALGTDTGGSIRCPASYCGVSGIKPTFGLVPTEGVVPWAYSLDHVGPIARTATDCALLLAAASNGARSNGTDRRPDLAGVRVGVVRADHLNPEFVSPELPAVFEQAVSVLQDCGALTRDVALARYDDVVRAAMLIIPAEGYAFHRSNLRRRWVDYGTQTRAQIVAGAAVGADAYIDAQRMASFARSRMQEMMTEFDVLVMPTTGIPAVLIEALYGTDLRELIGTTIYTPYWDITGNPALTVPMGFSTDGLPFGLQLVADWNHDFDVLAVGEVFQRHTAWLQWPTALPQPAVPTAADRAVDQLGDGS